MRLIENQRVELDNQHLEDCLLRNCILVLGGGPFNIRPSAQIESSCKLEVHGCAANTVAALNAFWRSGMKAEVLRFVKPQAEPEP